MQHLRTVEEVVGGNGEIKIILLFVIDLRKRRHSYSSRRGRMCKLIPNSIKLPQASNIYLKEKNDFTKDNITNRFNFFANTLPMCLMRHQTKLKFPPPHHQI